MEKDTSLGYAVRMLDLSRWTAPQKAALHRLAKKVVTEFYKERDGS